MRWFKHMTGSHNDEALCRMMDEFGLEGYGAFWIVLETIAAQCDKSNKTALTLSIKNWRKIVPFAPQKLTKWLAFADQLTLFCVEIHENLITVSCPKLLKYRDEYSERRSKKSGECRENIPPDTDTETELENITPPSPLSGGCAPGCSDAGEQEKPAEPSEQSPQAPPAAKLKRELKPKVYHPDFEAVWAAAHPLMLKCGKISAGASWEKARAAGVLPPHSDLVRSLAAYRTEQEAKVDPKVCHLSVWLNQGRWDTGQALEGQTKAQRNTEREAADRRQEQEREARAAEERRWSELWLALPETKRQEWRDFAVKNTPLLRQMQEDGKDLSTMADIAARIAWRKHREEKERAQRAAA